MKISGSDMRALGGLIREARKGRGMSARQLAALAGMSDAHLIYIERGLRRPSFHMLANLLGALGMGVDDALSGIGLAPLGAERVGNRPLYRVPVVTWVQAGAWREVCDSFEPGDADTWIDSDVGGGSIFALRVTGDSMEPEFHEGEIIIVNPMVEAVPGDFVVVKNADGEATFKQLKKYGARWVLHPLNPRHEDMEVRRGQFTVIGRVVKKEKRY